MAFCGALKANNSVVKVLGDKPLRSIARELVETVPSNVTIEWTLRENVRAHVRVLFKRILLKHGYSPDKVGDGYADHLGAGRALIGPVGYVTGLGRQRQSTAAADPANRDTTLFF